MKGKHDNYSLAKMVIYLLVFLIAISVFVVFRDNQDNILASDYVSKYMGLVGIGFMLLVGLVYLVSNSSHTPSASKSSKSKKRRSR